MSVINPKHIILAHLPNFLFSLGKTSLLSAPSCSFLPVITCAYCTLNPRQTDAIYSLSILMADKYLVN